MALVLAIAMCVLLTPPARQPALQEVLDRTAAYVNDYRKRLVGIVAEELYLQNVDNVSRGGRRQRQFRQLRSDLLLVKLAGQEHWLQFRDVFEVDRKPVRDRDERLYRLFVTPTADAQQQAETIQAESARYNIGPVVRTINMPILGLLFFDRQNQPQMKIRLLEANNTRRFAALANPVAVVRIGFTEVGTPTLIRGAGDKDLPARGEIWVDSTSGRILRTELECNDLTLYSNIQVTYRAEPSLTMLVPAEMREVYRLQVNASRIDGRATYSRFRQFTVTTTEKPKPQ